MEVQMNPPVSPISKWPKQSLGRNGGTIGKGFQIKKEPERMNELCTYHIEVRGRVDEDDLNAMSPLHVKRVGEKPGTDPTKAATIFTIHSDQSGLIGLLRHLHARGLIFLCIRLER
jgi:hypothetical protein